VSCCNNRCFTEALIERFGHRKMLNAHLSEQQQLHMARECICACCTAHART
jgi:hypothetical protein